MKEINIYSTDKNGFEELSNILHGPFKILLGDKKIVYTFPTVEHYYQWTKACYAKRKDVANQIYNAKTGWDARKLGTTLKLQEIDGWDNINVEFMKKILISAFKQNEKQRELLLSTENAVLTHKHKYIKLGKWEVEFPKILMEIRDNYVKEKRIC